MPSSYGLIKDAIAPACLRIVLLLVEIASHVSIEISLQVSNLRVIDIVFIDLLGDNVETNVIFFLKHDLHLVKDKLEFLSFVH